MSTASKKKRGRSFPPGKLPHYGIPIKGYAWKVYCIQRHDDTTYFGRRQRIPRQRIYQHRTLSQSSKSFRRGLPILAIFGTWTLHISKDDYRLPVQSLVQQQNLRQFEWLPLCQLCPQKLWIKTRRSHFLHFIQPCHWKWTLFMLLTSTYTTVIWYRSHHNLVLSNTGNSPLLSDTKIYRLAVLETFYTNLSDSNTITQTMWTKFWKLALAYVHVTLFTVSYNTGSIIWALFLRCSRRPTWTPIVLSVWQS